MNGINCGVEVKQLKSRMAFRHELRHKSLHHATSKTEQVAKVLT